MLAFKSKGSTLILIGPKGKTVEDVGELLATQLNKPFIQLRELTDKYAEEIGFTREDQKEAGEKDGFNGFYHYMQTFFTHVIKRVVQKHKGSIIVFDPLQSVIENGESLGSIVEYLKPFDVVQLRPTEDDAESVEIIRRQRSAFVDGKEMNEHFITHHSNSDLAKHTFYTKEKTPEQTADEILTKINAEASDIILIGAMGVGKSTIGKLLASKLDLPQVSMDKLRWEYYKETDWSEERQEDIRGKEGFSGVYKYWKRYDVHAIERLRQEHKNCVIDFGAGHSIYENSEDFTRVSELLAPYGNVVLLLPSPDLDESISILKDRHADTINGVEVIEYLVSHPSTQELADFTIFTENRTLSEIMDEILTEVDVTTNTNFWSRILRR